MPRETLTRDRIVAAAIALLDAGGLDGLHMRALGQRLGSAPTAVYWHVGSKDNLIALAGDRVWHEIALPAVTADGWRDAATEMAHGLHAMITRHPWLMEAFGSFVMAGPGKARHDDHNLGVYAAAGFTGVRAAQAAAAVYTYVIGNALGPAAGVSLARKLARQDGAASRMRARLAQYREVAAQFPRLRGFLDTASAEFGATPGQSFEFGLQALLDGLAAQLTRPAPAG